MIHKICLVLGLVSIIFMSCVTIAEAGITPILPVDNNLLGFDFQYDINQNIASYIGVAIGLDNSEVVKHLGAKLTFGKATYDLNYSYWLKPWIPGYLYQNGFEGKMLYAFTPDQNITVSIFDGRVGREEREQIETKYIFLGYNKQLYNNWDCKADLYSGITAGQTGQTADNFYTSELSLPFKIKNFKIVPTFGYIEQNDSIGPYYDLAKYVRGYVKEVQTGNRIFALTLEQQYPLFPYSDKPFLGLLNGVIFIDSGDVLAPNQQTNDFKIHSSAGAGLVLNVVSTDLELVETVTDQGDWRTQFYYRMAF